MEQIKKLVVATHNQHKFKEISDNLREIDVQLISLTDFPKVKMAEEDQATFKGNALKKAQHVCRQLNLPAMADDSGLVVESMGGKPGVYSARYAGETASDTENLEKLLRDMKGVPLSSRAAYYVCSLCVVFSTGQEWFVEERCDGRIALEPRGSGGFGYDPIFFPVAHQKTMAELSLSEKNKISHRGLAIQKLKQFLLSF